MKLKLMLTQPPTKLELEMELRMAKSVDKQGKCMIKSEGWSQLLARIIASFNGQA